MDDILVLNDPQFLSTATLIYDNSLELEITHNGDRCCYLDLDVAIANNTLSVEVYNKVDAFPFVVNRFGYPDSNVSVRTHSTVLFSQFIRFCRLTTTLDACYSAFRQMIRLYRGRGFDHCFIDTALRQFVRTK